MSSTCLVGVVDKAGVPALDLCGLLGVEDTMGGSWGKGPVVSGTEAETPRSFDTRDAFNAPIWALRSAIARATAARLFPDAVAEDEDFGRFVEPIAPLAVLSG